MNNEKLLAIAYAYLKGMGYTENQYLIFRRYDADHLNVHLLVNRITFDEEVVSDSNT
ncbi:relaxase/mobilization nuclease domain-containing protein [Mucilaginibacter daejeonensis]|uniref:relaxase/mobilization nuclease domain-containing protein n=1 Tax=Mucilaginibacter daejeonensis TaxID=398049 RepID=UPI001D177A2F|nr:relaxase/mobilization nuclease domain-containing protein [Mucilaginibacter daejeonensis]UEG54041.1 relaxase/mobilization nuclease domain-containing protein [Mucilaginibacter daejeonensis]